MRCEASIMHDEVDQQSCFVEEDVEHPLSVFGTWLDTLIVWFGTSGKKKAHK